MEKDLLTEIQEDFKNAGKKKRERKPKVEEKKGLRFVTKVKIGIALIAVVVGSAYLAAESYHNWRATNQPQFPYQWRGWVRKIETATNIVANAQSPKAMTDMEVIEQYHLSPVLKTVYFLESTSGQNDGCKEQGQFNGFGYAQNSSQWKCYESFEKVVEKVNEWFEERLSMNGNDLVEATCFYNRGVQGLQVCDYSVNFFSVLTKNF